MPPPHFANVNIRHLIVMACQHHTVVALHFAPHAVFSCTSVHFRSPPVAEIQTFVCNEQPVTQKIQNFRTLAAPLSQFV